MSRPFTRAAAVVLAVLLAGAAGAADPAFDLVLRDSLADVHNKGADLYNQANDYAGAYRLYEGALRTARPLLPHRPAVQKVIDEGLSAAAKETVPDRKAFLLHVAIEKVRSDLKVPATGKTAPEPKKTPEPTPEPKKTTSDPKKTPDPKTTTPDPKTTPEPKKTPDPKATIPEPKKTPDPKTTTPEPKKTEPMPPAKVDEAKKGGPAGGPVVRGVLTLKGLPVANADLMFVSLDRPAPVVVTAKTNADGTYSTNLVAGRYAVTVVAAGKGAVPARYATTDTSGLTVVVSAGSNAFDIALQ